MLWQKTLTPATPVPFMAVGTILYVAIHWRCLDMPAPDYIYLHAQFKINFIKRQEKLICYVTAFLLSLLVTHLIYSL